MLENLRRMELALKEWLIKEEILGDARFYQVAEWQAKGEKYHLDSCLVLMFDGSSLHTMLNFGGDTEEFDDLITSFGFWYELGHSWNLGFYPEDNYNYLPTQGTYSQKLNDPRWKRKAALIKEKTGQRCQDCGKTGPLEAHHCYYLNMRDGYEPWEYPLSAFRALCPPCHKSRDKAEIRMRAFMAGITQSEMDTLRAGLTDSFYWFKREAVINFITKIRHSDEQLMEAVLALLAERKDTEH